MSTALFEIAPQEPSRDTPGAIESAVIETLTELAAAGRLSGKYKAIGEALKHTAKAIDRGLAQGKVSVATAQLTKQLYETLEKLPEPQVETGSAFDTLEATISALTLEALSA
ncbi:hypothetical protein [Trueperella pyogenes]|uniref:hypothetical protein n=1 Tax=Trueperella pyogenes TaxID=1661 RepID=UPI0006B24D13|nr:hypothetical protein [Trueperella pyogenes]ALD74576.1 hypothetical protein AN946_10020 [Trueperella pyogenes]